jgi:hypothetical protein
MNYLFIKRATVLTIVFLLELSGCVRQAHSAPLLIFDDGANDPRKLTIIEAENIKKLAADASDNPKFYAIRGKLVRSSEVEAQFLENKTPVCYTRLDNYHPFNNETISNLSVSKGQSEESRDLYFINFSYENANSEFAIVCLKYKHPVTIQDAQKALSGIVIFGP